MIRTGHLHDNKPHTTAYWLGHSKESRLHAPVASRRPERDASPERACVLLGNDAEGRFDETGLESTWLHDGEVGKLSGYNGACTGNTAHALFTETDKTIFSITFKIVYEGFYDSWVFMWIITSQLVSRFNVIHYIWHVHEIYSTVYNLQPVYI